VTHGPDSITECAAPSGHRIRRRCSSFEEFEALKSAPVALIAKDGQFTWWQWRKVRHGFRDEALRPYNYNLGPFLANQRAIQQGYSVAEPIYVEKQGGFKPVVHLLADHGFSTYSTLIETTRETVAKRPEYVQKFVDASILGWASYMNGDRSKANALMLKENPEMTLDAVRASVRPRHAPTRRLRHRTVLRFARAPARKRRGRTRSDRD
jgi:NitT/TauT family transport system substrate-binding protein